jgi:hypothetical protein
VPQNTGNISAEDRPSAAPDRAEAKAANTLNATNTTRMKVNSFCGQERQLGRQNGRQLYDGEGKQRDQL